MSSPFVGLVDAIRDEHWLDSAACTPLTSELFWVDKGGSTGPAKAICRDCPVRRQCLEHALRHREHEGIWGGLSPAERKGMKPDIERPANECVNGHDLDIVGVRKDGYCRQCDKERWQRYRERKKQGLVPSSKPKPRHAMDPTRPEAHGLYRHNLGCRCLICCDANAEKQRKIRAKKRLKVLDGGAA